MTDVIERPALDLEPLLAPIAGEAAAGQWLRFDPLYEEIRKLREADDPSLPQGVWQRELKRADWSGVADRAAAALATRTKDLQLAAWLTEAMLHRDGFAGLECGLRLIAALCREYWDGLYPPLEGENSDARLAPVVWAADKFPLAIKQIPITAPAGEDEATYAWVDSELALYQANLAKSRGSGAPPETGVVTHPQFLAAVSLTPAPWYAGLASQLTKTLAAIDELEEVLVALAGEAQAPSMASMRTPLTAIQSFISRVLAERVQSGELPPWGVPNDATPPFEGPDLDTPRRGAPITSRADAFQRLRESAEYLMRTEPHSPVPYLIRRAITWEHMTLAELLEELLAKNTDLATIYALLGIRK
jgi:type VI secretion system protein ImpA